MANTIKVISSSLLTPVISLKDEDKGKLASIKKVMVEPKESTKANYRIDDKSGVLYVSNNLWGKILEQRSNENTDYFLDPKNQGECTHNVLKNVFDVLARVYDRRTNTPSWILLAALKVMGFKSINEVEAVFKNQQFKEVFGEYFRLKKNSNSSPTADKFLEEAFKNNEQKKNLIKLAYRMVGIANSLSNTFINAFPIAFSLQNIIMPFLARGFQERPIGKLFDFLRLINPWVGDFVAELAGNFKHELHEIRKFSNITEEVNTKKDQEEKEINLLSPEEYELQKIVKKVNEAFTRLFGKGTTISSWLLRGVLWCFGGHEDYQKFAAKYVDNPDFIKKLYQHLKSEDKVKFDKEERVVANIILGVVRIARSLSPQFIKNTSNIFGLPYSIQNLFMPIIAKFVHEGPLAKIIHFLRDINPLISDLFVDHIGNFRKEILDIQKEPLIDLFPKLDIQLGVVKKGLSNLCASVKSLLAIIRDFSKGLYGKATKAATKPGFV